MTERVVLTLNAGSSSLKAAAYSLQDRQLAETPLLRIHFSGLNGRAGTQVHIEADESEVNSFQLSALDNRGALEKLFSIFEERLAGRQATAVGHRIVHGGTKFANPAALDARITDTLQELSPLAPQHQPFNLAGVEYAATHWPAAKQVACFDTAFHRTLPLQEQRFALPQRFEAEGVIRYGFHGLSYEYIADAAPKHIGESARGRMIVAHLGAGASLCAMRDLKSVATTMGFTALDGLPMATRCGAIDPGVVLYLLQEKGMSAAEVADCLYSQSGLLGLSGVSGDMRELAHSKEQRAAEAVDYFVSRCVREIGGLASVLGGLDCLVFTAGIGENAPAIRAAILSRLRWLGLDCDVEANDANRLCIYESDRNPTAWVIPTNEELIIAKHASRFV